MFESMRQMGFQTKFVRDTAYTRHQKNEWAQLLQIECDLQSTCTIRNKKQQNISDCPTSIAIQESIKQSQCKKDAESI